MSAIRSSNTKPEQIISALLNELGFTYVAQFKELTGTPDFFLAELNTAIFVHGCYWHGHNCHLFKEPSTRKDFWLDKIASNKTRDAKVLAELSRLHIRVLIIWECSLKGSKKLPPFELKTRIEEYVLSESPYSEICHSGFVIE